MSQMSTRSTVAVLQARDLLNAPLRPAEQIEHRLAVDLEQRDCELELGPFSLQVKMTWIDGIESLWADTPSQ